MNLPQKIQQITEQLKKQLTKFLAFSTLIAIVPLLGSLAACTKAEKAKPEEPAYHFENDQIVLNPSSPFMKRLEVIKVAEVANGDAAFKTVGQIIALANASGVLSNSDLSWSQLDPGLTKAAGLHLGVYKKATVGTAFGMTLIPAEYASQIHEGQKVEIARYGLKKSDIQAFVATIQTGKGDSKSAYVTFEIRGGQDWYPGTNCEVRFPLLHAQTVGVPTTAILHEGLSEFVMKEMAPGHFLAMPVFIVDETPDTAQVIGLSAHDSVVASGAILLKPQMHGSQNEKKEAQHELQ